MDFFENTFVFNFVTFILTVGGIILTVWLAIRKYPKRLTLYYESSKFLWNQTIPNLASIKTDSKNIQINPDKWYLTTTLYLQNSGSKDFNKSDFVDGIKIKFPPEYKIIEVLHKDYPREINSSNHTLGDSEFEIVFDTFKKKEIIRYDIIGELASNISILKGISFKCRGSDIAKGNIEKVTDKRSFKQFEELILGLLATFLLVILLCFAFGFIGEKANYSELTIGPKRVTGILYHYSYDSLAYFDLSTKKVVQSKIDSILRKQYFSVEAYPRRDLPFWIVIMMFMFPFAFLVSLFINFRKLLLKRQLEKVI